MLCGLNRMTYRLKSGSVLSKEDVVKNLPLGLHLIPVKESGLSPLE